MNDRPEETFKGFTLNSFQRDAAAAIREGKNLLVSAPTGAGKTLVAEYAIELAARNGKKCIYTSPIKALSNQKYRDFRDDPGVSVGIMTGDVTINPEGSLLIMTTEILRNTMFEDPRRLAEVEYVIFDEIHYMDDFERGTVWEESIIFLPPEIRLIGLSATIANIKQFGAWIGSIRPQPLEVVTSTTRPVPLSHRLYHPAGGVFDTRQTRKIQVKISRQRRRYRPREKDSRGLLNMVVEKKWIPALYFCFSRRDCEALAEKNRSRNLLVPEERDRMDAQFAETCRGFEIEVEGEVARLRNLALRGVGFHHAGMLPLHKELVERMFTSGLLKLLFTTETFAMGINMPARTVIFDSLFKFDGVNFSYLRTRDYMQMAGRAGRQGIDKKGLVISLLEVRDIMHAPLERIFHGKVEPIRSKFNLSYSTIINLYEHLQGRIFEAWLKSFHSFQNKELSPRKAEKHRQRQLALIQAKIDLLTELGYLDEKGVTERGKIAAQINGYELQVTEFLFSGIFEEMNPHQINVLLAATIYEPRRLDRFDRPEKGILGKFRPQVTKIINHLIHREESHGVPDPIRPLSLETAGVTFAWSQGRDFEDLFDRTNLAPGDLVRTFRMTIQLLRQLRKALRPGENLGSKLSECMDCLNRDVVDAKKQLELG